jgi:hypothetical protein
MSRKSILITLRKENFFLNLYSFNAHNFPLGLHFLRYLKSLFLKKSILVIKENLNFSNNTLYLILDLFFETKKLKSYKKQTSSCNSKKRSFKESTLNSIVNLLVKKIRVNNLFLKFKVVNNFIDKDFMLFIFASLKKYISLIFLRRFNLYIDLIKLTSLYLKKKVTVDIYLNLITVVFKNLGKRSHSSFFLFFKELFNILVFSKKSLSLLGIKLVINGRLKGKPRSSTVFINAGCTPSQTLSANIDYAKAHTYTKKFGVLGFKLWINRQKN